VLQLAQELDAAKAEVQRLQQEKRAVEKEVLRLLALLVQKYKY
jgi:hypothetical protein